MTTQPLDIRYTDSHPEAIALRDAGYEPIECAFGGYGSVLGRFEMDHHGAESWRVGVAIRACAEAYGGRKDDPRFVVTGTPDADAVLAIIALAGLVERAEIPAGFPELVDLHDRSPIGLDLANEEHGTLLLAFDQTHLERGQPGFVAAVTRMIELIRLGVSDEERRKVIGTERSRLQRASKALEALVGPDGAVTQQPNLGQPAGRASRAPRVAVVRSTVWGFDVWYQWAPVVVSYSERLKKVTLGCPDIDTAEACFGPGGLLAIYPALGEGWGGREAVGGSPRGVPMTFEDALATAKTVAPMLRVVAAG